MYFKLGECQGNFQLLNLKKKKNEERESRVESSQGFDKQVIGRPVKSFWNSLHKGWRGLMYSGISHAER